MLARYNKIWIYILLLLIVALYIYKISGVAKGLDSLYDEGFLLMKLWQTRHQLGMDGMSQWPVIVSKILGFTGSGDLITLRLSEYIFQILGVCVSFYSFIFYLKKENIKIQSEDKTVLLSLLLLAELPTFGMLFIYYNPIQQVLFQLILSGLLVFRYLKPFRAGIILFFVGFLSLFTMIVIPPSGLLVLLLVLIYVFFSEDKFNFRRQIVNVIYVVCGVILAIVFYHFFFNRIDKIISDAMVISETISKTHRGYDIKSFALKYILYLKDLILPFVLLLFSLIVTGLVWKYINHYLSVLICAVLLFFAGWYLEKNISLTSTYILFIAVIALISSLRKNVYSFISNNKLFLLFLIFPFAAVLGTNVYYGGKINWFDFSWVFIPFLFLRSSSSFSGLSLTKNKYPFYAILLLFYLIPNISTIRDLNKNQDQFYYQQQKPVAKIAINQYQKAYFDKINNIVSKYGFIENKSTFFSTQLDMMTTYALGGVPVAVYFQPTDFMVDPKRMELPSPDFIFLTQYDINVMQHELQKLNWGFPANYDQFFVGTPETLQTPYSTNRWLFCRKIKK